MAMTARRKHAISVPVLWAALLLSGSVGLTLVQADEEVVVYSARSHYGQEPAFEAFTKQTGIVIKNLGGNDSELFERLRADGYL